MADGQVTIRTRKMMRNNLLARRQFVSTPRHALSRGLRAAHESATSTSLQEGLAPLRDAVKRAGARAQCGSRH